eukprot:Rmarinus@m.24849
MDDISSDTGRCCEVFVWNLPRDVRDEQLRTPAEEHGPIKHLIIKRDKGFAFIVYRSHLDAIRAVKLLDGMEIDGTRLGFKLSTANRKLFIGNLPKSTSRSDLENWLNHISPGLQEIEMFPSPHDERKHRGFIFAEYGSKIEAEKSLQVLKRMKMEHQRWNGTIVDPEWAKPVAQPDKATMDKVRTVFLRNLSAETDEQRLWTLCEKFGKVERVKRIRDRDLAFVDFSDRTTAVQCIRVLNHYVLDGRKLEVQLAKPLSASRQPGVPTSSNSTPTGTPVMSSVALMPGTSPTESQGLLINRSSSEPVRSTAVPCPLSRSHSSGSHSHGISVFSIHSSNGSTPPARESPSSGQANSTPSHTPSPHALLPDDSRSLSSADAKSLSHTPSLFFTRALPHSHDPTASPAASNTRLHCPHHSFPTTQSSSTLSQSASVPFLGQQDGIVASSGRVSHSQQSRPQSPAVSIHSTQSFSSQQQSTRSESQPFDISGLISSSRLQDVNLNDISPTSTSGESFHATSQPPSRQPSGRPQQPSSGSTHSRPMLATTGPSLPITVSAVGSLRAESPNSEPQRRSMSPSASDPWSSWRGMPAGSSPSTLSVDVAIGGSGRLSNTGSHNSGFGAATSASNAGSSLGGASTGAELRGSGMWAASPAPSDEPSIGSYPDTATDPYRARMTTNWSRTGYPFLDGSDSPLAGNNGVLGAANSSCASSPHPINSPSIQDSYFGSTFPPSSALGASSLDSASRLSLLSLEDKPSHIPISSSAGSYPGSNNSADAGVGFGSRLHSHLSSNSLGFDQQSQNLSKSLPHSFHRHLGTPIDARYAGYRTPPATPGEAPARPPHPLGQSAAALSAPLISPATSPARAHASTNGVNGTASSYAGATLATSGTTASDELEPFLHTRRVSALCVVCPNKTAYFELRPCRHRLCDTCATALVTTAAAGSYSCPKCFTPTESVAVRDS